MEFGFESEGGSGSNPFLCIDGIKLYKIGEADPVKLIESDFHDLMDECQELAAQHSATFWRCRLKSATTDLTSKTLSMVTLLRWKLP